MNYADPDFSLRHYMRDVVILLGGKPEVADLLDKSKDGVTEADVEKVRDYAIQLFGEVKSIPMNLHKLNIEIV